jgi:LPXTG-site transpeptidase (sortase) family protein
MLRVPTHYLLIGIGLILATFMVGSIVTDVKQVALAREGGELKLDTRTAFTKSGYESAEEISSEIVKEVDVEVNQQADNKPEPLQEIEPETISDDDLGYRSLIVASPKEGTEDYKPEPVITSVIENPQRLIIPAIDLNVGVMPVEVKQVYIEGEFYQQWPAPDKYAVGWHSDSAQLGAFGNTVLNGHHNVYGEVFRNLEYSNEGDIILLYGDEYVYTYEITNKMYLPERDEPLEVRLENARWILPTEDERLTLVTCWPYYTNIFRLVIVARPLAKEPILTSYGENWMDPSEVTDISR